MPQVNREIVDFRRAEERLGRRYQPGNFPGAINLLLSGRNLAAGACANQARA
jgi:hypothetical protein